MYVCYSSNTEYRKDQDIFTEFHNTYIDPTPSRNRFNIKQQDLLQKFKEWFNKFYSGQTIPNGKEVRGYFEKNMVSIHQMDGRICHIRVNINNKMSLCKTLYIIII